MEYILSQSNPIKSEHLKAQKLLLDWFKKEGRHHLPWRNTRDVYRVLVSEIMLQQTQAERVAKDYYPHFLKSYPTISDLAKASLDDVLSHWSGLGYYVRARNLHKLAKICQKRVPQNMQDLQKLPGVGRYTASAVCSFALEQSVAVVDTNIKRVLLRYFGLHEQNLVLEFANSFLNHKDSRRHNLALMDLGSLICVPKNPTCKDCPLNITCKGRENPELFTLKKPVQYENMELFLGVNIRNKKLALVRSSSKLYNGLYLLPQVDPVEENFLGSFKHSYTKYRLKVNLYKSFDLVKGAKYFTYEELQDAPISSMTKKALKFINF